MAGIKRPVILSDGRRFASQAECAKALGVSPSTVRDAVANGTEDFIGTGSGRRPSQQESRNA